MTSTIDTGMWALTDEQLASRVVELFKEKARLEAECAKAVAEVQDRELVRLAGCSSDVAWLAATTGVSRGEASKTVRVARELNDEVSPTVSAWSAGELTSEKAATICKAINTLPDWVDGPARSAAQAHLLALAKEFCADNLKRLANHVIEVIDPDGAEEHLGRKLEQEEKNAWAKTELSFSNIGDGLTRIRGTLPNVQAGMLRTALEGLASPRRNDPNIWDRDGDHCDAANGTLTHQMRLGRAMCQFIEHLPSEAMPQHGGLAASVTVNIDLDALRDQIGIATLSTGDDMSAAQARRFACNASLIPIVLDGTSKTLDLGMAKRLHDRYQRIALANRDQGCCWKGCNRPPSWCEAHHLIWYSRGGPTSIENGALFCFYHHHLLHSGEWDARMSPDGIVEVIPPTRIDPDQKPLRHDRFRNGP